MKQKIPALLLMLLLCGTLHARKINLSGETDGDYLDITLWEDNGITAGYSLLPEPMLVVGHWETYPGDIGTYYGINITMYEADGRVQGTYLFHLREAADGTLSFEDGELTYIDPYAGTGTKQFKDITCQEKEEIAGEGPLQPATQDDLSEIYEYILPEERGGFFEMMVESDGSVIFDTLDRPAGDGVASAANDANRPGRLVGNVMEYERVNDCGDTLCATFFRDFVVVETQQVSGPKHDCNPINAVFVKKSYSE